MHNENFYQRTRKLLVCITVMAGMSTMFSGCTNTNVECTENDVTADVIYESTEIEDEVQDVCSSEAIELSITPTEEYHQAAVADFMFQSHYMDTLEEMLIPLAEFASITEKEPEPDYSEVPLDDDLVQAIIDNCKEFEIPVPICLGIIDVESGFTVDLDSSGCYGLMSLNKRYFPTDLTPAENIHAGLEFLRKNLDKCDGDMMLALNIYNAGHISGNMKYSNKVMRRAEYWAEVTGAPMT